MEVVVQDQQMEQQILVQVVVDVGMVVLLQEVVVQEL